ncbi:MAG: carboxypeptidase regulatory-like domain-containing protein [Deltaproteobacteria bacterium]|nr:MAG: carboxypeptidase regulatory-like domain-containing protein [Deltaproteobacteria bacterium]
MHGVGYRLVVAGFVGLLGMFLVPRGADALEIDVVAPTRLELSVDSSPAMLRVEGRLMDNTARGVPFRELTLSLADEELLLVTDRLGRVVVERRRAGGRVPVTLRFEGEPWLLEAESTMEVVVPRWSPELEVGVGDVQWPDRVATLRGSVRTQDGAVAGAELRVTSNCPVESARPRTDAEGRFRIGVHTSREQAGHCALEVTLVEDEWREPAHWSGVVPYARHLDIEVRAGRVGPEGRVRARTTAGHVPVPGVMLRLLAGDETVSGAVSDADGHFAFAWPESVEPGSSFAVALDRWGGDGERRQELVEGVSRPAERWRAWMLPFLGTAGLMLVLVTLLLLALDWRRAGAGAFARRRDPGLVTRRSMLGGGRTRLERVARKPGTVQVLDADTGGPIIGARLLFGQREVAVTDGAGCFDRAALLTPGVGTMVVTAPGYRDLEVGMPLVGDHLRLESRRRDLLRIYSAVLERVGALERQDWWGRVSVFDARDRGLSRFMQLRRRSAEAEVTATACRTWVDRARSSTGRARVAAAVEALALLTDRALFSGEPVGANVVALAEELQAMVGEEIDGMTLRARRKE